MSSRQEKRRKNREIQKRKANEQRTRVFGDAIFSKLYQKELQREKYNYIKRQHVGGKSIKWSMETNHEYFKKLAR